MANTNTDWRERMEPALRELGARRSLRGLSAFLLGEFQGDFDIAAAIEAGNRANG
jgi:hypothetical protein